VGTELARGTGGGAGVADVAVFNSVTPLTEYFVSVLTSNYASQGLFNIDVDFDVDPLGEAVWNDDSAVGAPGDGNNWADADNWTVDGINDQLPAIGPSGDNVTFATAPTVGSIDLGRDRTVNTSTFQDGYALFNHTLTVTTGQVEVESRVTATIRSNLASGIPAGISKQGSGTLVVANTAPNVVFDLGTLEFTSTASINNLTINGGTAIVTGTVNGNLINNGGTLVPAAPGDFNLNGLVDAADVDALYAQLPGTVPAVHARFDIVPDGIIDQQDVDRLIHDFMHSDFGDVDLDGDVDITDFSTLAVRFDPRVQNQHNRWAQGNFDGDLDVDISDFNQLVRNFSPTGYGLRHTPSATTVIVPPPDRLTRQLFELSDEDDAPVQLDLDEPTGSQAPEARAGNIVDDFAFDVATHRGRKKVADAALAGFSHAEFTWVP